MFHSQNTVLRERTEKTNGSLGDRAWSQYTIWKRTRAHGQKVKAFEGSTVVLLESSQRIAV